MNADAEGEGAADQLRRAQRRLGLPTGRPAALPRCARRVEAARSYEMPDITALPDGPNVAAEFCGGACALRLDGDNHRVYVHRFHYAGFATQGGGATSLL